MGVLLESPRFIRWRWDLDDSDFNRLFTFCVLLVVILMAYVFTNNDSSGGPAGLFHGDAAKNVVNSSILTTTRFLRWLPMTTFAFIAAQVFNLRDSVPLTAVSLMLRWRRRRGDQSLAGKYVNVSYPYFMVCLWSAGIHFNAGTQYYFWGQCVLIGWALWGLRSQRFPSLVWLFAFVAAIGLGYAGQFGINFAQTYIQNFDAKWMSRFFHGRTDPLQSMTAMGDIGELKLSSEIVIWLEPQDPTHVPAYLREASYRSYRGRSRSWEAGTPNGFLSLNYEPDGTSIDLLPESPTNHVTGKATVNIACFLDGWSAPQSWPEGLLPLPTGTRRLDHLPDSMVWSKNENGAILAGGRGLVLFDATYAPGATIDAPPDLNPTNHSDLWVPYNETYALNQVISELNLATNADLSTTLRAIDRFFLTKFSYSTWQEPGNGARTNITTLSHFLLSTRKGHCEFFATSTVLLLRELGIPARYAVGYAVHENRGTGFVVRERDAHAWCLVWNQADKCWQDFDTTPPSWIAIESKRTAFWEWLSDARSWIRYEFAAFRWRQANLQQYILWALIPVMVVLLFHIIFRRRGRLKANARGDREAAVSWPGLDSEFYQLEKKLAAFGLPRQAGEPLSVWLERVSSDPALAALRDPLKLLLRLHYRHRFDPRGLDASERDQLRREAKACLDSLLAPRS